MILYIGNLGVSAAKHFHIREAKLYYRYTEAILFCGRQVVEYISQKLGAQDSLIILEQEFYGVEGYQKAVRDICKQAYNLQQKYASMGECLDEVIVNSSGGTEKMSCIIKDCIPILKQMFPLVNHIWGCSHGYHTVFSKTPEIFVEDYLPEAKVKGEAPKIVRPPDPEPPEIITHEVVIKRKKYRPPDPKKQERQQLIEAREQLRKAKRQAKREELENKRKAEHLKKMERNTLGMFGEVVKSLFSGDEEERNE